RRRTRRRRQDRGDPGRTMSAMPLALRRSEHDRVIAGVCAGIAESIGVDPTLVRLVFTILALAGGAGIVLYAAAWLTMTGRGRIAVLPPLRAAALALRGLGLSPHVAAALVLISAGFGLIWWRGGSLRPGAPLPLAGLALVVIGVALLLARGPSSSGFLAPPAGGGAPLLLLGPWPRPPARRRRPARARPDRPAEP